MSSVAAEAQPAAQQSAGDGAAQLPHPFLNSQQLGPGGVLGEAGASGALPSSNSLPPFLSEQQQQLFLQALQFAAPSASLFQTSSSQGQQQSGAQQGQTTTGTQQVPSNYAGAEGAPGAPATGDAQQQQRPHYGSRPGSPTDPSGQHPGARGSNDYARGFLPQQFETQVGKHPFGGEVCK